MTAKAGDAAVADVVSDDMGSRVMRAPVSRSWVDAIEVSDSLPGRVLDRKGGTSLQRRVEGSRGVGGYLDL